MHPVDYSLIAAYLVALLGFGVIHRIKGDTSAAELILGGRSLTLPAFVASLVSTWYGGILGVGEYTYLYGLSNWLVFGLPYYLAAALFAIFLARKARQSEVLTIPERLAGSYNQATGIAGSVIIFVMTVPAAYVLILGSLGQVLFGWPLWVGILAGTAFSVVYVYLGGFRSVIRTDLFQFGLMFVGFAVLLGILVGSYGGLSFLKENVPASHFTWHGGNAPLYIVSWYFIALATLIEPSFHQRCYAAKNESVARNGIFVSIGCWAVFDFLTTTTGLYARAILPDLANPVTSYPELATAVLPVGLLGLFFLSLLATVMSTVDSYAFLAASTFGNDIARPLLKLPERKVTLYTRIGLVLTVVLAIAIAALFRSVIDIWYVLGSIGTPALLVPVFFSFVGKKRMPPWAAFWCVVVSGAVTTLWYLSQHVTGDGAYWLGWEPIFPGLVLSVGIYLMTARRHNV